LQTTSLTAWNSLDVSKTFRFLLLIIFFDNYLNTIAL